MRFTPEISALQRWRRWGGALIVAEIGWFALQRPRIAGNSHGVFLLSLIPVAVIGYVYLLAAVSAYLEQRDWDYRFRQLIVVMLGLSVGLFVFALTWLTQVQSEAQLEVE